MKKTYTKPEILFESFTLSTNIAGTCAVDTSLQAEGTCGFLWGDEIIFLTGISDCGPDPFETDDGTSGICYHNPTDTTNLFNS